MPNEQEVVFHQKYHLLLIIGRDEKSLSNRFSPEAGNSAAADRPERYPRRQPIMDWEKRGGAETFPLFTPSEKHADPEC